jgi:hypothetical protein
MLLYNDKAEALDTEVLTKKPKSAYWNDDSSIDSALVEDDASNSKHSSIPELVDASVRILQGWDDELSLDSNGDYC